MNLEKKQTEAGISKGNVKKVVLDVQTTWNSSLYMQARFLEMSSQLHQILINDPKGPPMLTAVELELSKQLLKVLKPLSRLYIEVPYEVTEEVMQVAMQTQSKKTCLIYIEVGLVAGSQS